MLNATFSVIFKHCGQILSFLKVVFTLFLSFIQILRFISSIVLHAALERIYTLSQQNEYLFRCPKLEAIVFSKFEERKEEGTYSQIKNVNLTIKIQLFSKLLNVEKIANRHFQFHKENRKIEICRKNHHIQLHEKKRKNENLPKKKN